MISKELKLRKFMNTAFRQYMTYRKIDKSRWEESLLEHSHWTITEDNEVLEFTLFYGDHYVCSFRTDLDLHVSKYVTNFVDKSRATSRATWASHL